MGAFFYMVFVEGGATPAHKHWTCQDAEAEVERLTRKEGKPTYVLAAVAKCTPPTPSPVQWVLPEPR